MARKQRSDSAAAAINAAVNAAKPLPDLPSHVRLRESDKPFFAGILRARARDEWIDCDIVVAAQLARCQADIERESEALESEGSILRNDRGTQVMNPRHSVLQQLAQREMALMRSLRIAGTAAGDVRDLQKSRKLQQQAEKAREELSSDSDLLA